MKVAVVGTGYVGLPTGAVLADLGHQVVCIDRDEAKVETIRQARAPIFEPGLNELLQKVMASGHLSVSTSIAQGMDGAEVVFVAVGTPPGPDGRPDMSQVVGAAQEIGQNVKTPVVVVNKSTVPVGSGDLVEKVMLEQGANPALFDVVSNPEFLREGSAIKDSYDPDRIVIGAKRNEAADKLIELYRPLDADVFVTDVKSAELIKYASNSFLATKISFINAISRVCELCGADVEEVARGMGMDRRIGPEFLKAGLGWGGSCFPKDVDGLIATSSDLGYEFGMLAATKEVNKAQVDNFMSRLSATLGGFDGRTVALLGLAFKPNTDDIRDAKSLDVIEALKNGGASVRAYDPVAMPAVRSIHPDVHYADDEYGAVSGADAVIVVTEWGQFKSLDLSRLAEGMKNRVMFDGRRVFCPEDAHAAGFFYARVGSALEEGAPAGP